MKHRLPIFLSLALTVVAVYATAYDERSPWFLQCPLFHLFGLQCPFCGAQRMLHALLCGDAASAWRYNAALLTTLPLWCLLAAATLLPARMPWVSRHLLNGRAVATYLVAAALWMVVRNVYLS